MLNKGFINGRIVSIKKIEGKNYGFIRIATSKDYRDKITGEYETQFIDLFVPSEKRVNFIKEYFEIGDGITLMYKIETKEKEITEGDKTYTRSEIILVVEDLEILTVAKKIPKTKGQKENCGDDLSNIDFSNVDNSRNAIDRDELTSLD